MSSSRLVLLTYLDEAPGTPGIWPTPPGGAPPVAGQLPVFPPPVAGQLPVFPSPGAPVQLPVFPYDPTHPIVEPPADNKPVEPARLFALKWSPVYGWILVPVRPDDPNAPTPKSEG